MQTPKTLIESLGTAADVAAAVGKSRAAIEKWKERGSIPSSAWPALLKVLKRKGKNVSAADLLAMHMHSKSSPVSQPNNVGNAA